MNFKMCKLLFVTCLLALVIRASSAVVRDEKSNVPDVVLSGDSNETPIVRAVNIDIGIDVLGIGQAIGGAISSAENRDAFVKNVLNTVWYGAGERYNVMVFNLNVDHEERLSGVQFYGSVNYDGIIYGIWVFESGTFENKGDGGYINWAFRGWFERDGGYVKF